MRRFNRLAIAGLALTLTASAQEFLGEKDFLTQHEVDIIREMQEPNERVTTYLHFAALRVELINQLLAKDEDGRGGKVHENLDQYGRILEAIDAVVDDALLRDVNLDKAYIAMLTDEAAFLKRLREIQDSEPDDLWRFEFVLEDAIEITADSLEMAREDTGDRKRAILESDDAERAAREAYSSDARREEVEKVKQKQESKETEFESKRPSLLKKGETLEDVRRPKN